MTDSAGPVVVDLRAIQSPDHRGRGIGRYAYEFALALERRRPDLVSRYVLASAWPPPGDIEPLLSTGKVTYLPEPAELGEHVRVYHSMSPFELGVSTGDVWPAMVEQRGLRYSATVYDLIPLRHRETYLADARQRRRYRARSEMLRHADALLAISAAAEADLVELLAIDEGRIAVVGTGVSGQLMPPGSRFDAFEEARGAVTGLVDPFVLYPGGSDGRKNVEALVRAFALLPPAIRQGYQLVVPCELGELTANHFRHVAETEGVGDRLLLPGFVPDRVLQLLYQATSLMCFPSLAEGFGLPVAEAMACGAVVVTSDVSPLREMVLESARFDPRDVASIAAGIERGLTDATLRAEALAARWPLDSWDDVAERAGKVFDSLSGGRPRRWRSQARLAFVSPFPPIASGVAGYSARLVEALAAELGDTELACFADGRDRDAAEPEMPAGMEWRDARAFGVTERATGGYDDVLYVLGNSEYHAAALTALRGSAGVVMAHDVRLSNLLRFSAEVPGAVPGGVRAAVERAYGSGLLGPGSSSDGIAADDQERFGLLMLRDVLASARRVLVSSEASRRLAELDAGPEGSERIGVLPFALALPSEELAVIGAERLRRASSPDPRRSVIASFGIVDPTKQPMLIIEAVVSLSQAAGVGADLAFIGPISDSLRAALRSRADEAGISLELTGAVPRAEYLAWLGRADVAVQLRTSFGGEASAAVGDCLAAGIPTVVSDIGWLGGLPDEVVRKLERGGSGLSLAEHLERLLGDGDGRRALSVEAARYAADRSFAEVALALIRELRLPTVPSRAS